MKLSTFCSFEGALKEKDLVEVEPVKSRKRGRTVWYYDHIRMDELEKLTANGLEEILNMSPTKGKFRVILTSFLYMLQGSVNCLIFPSFNPTFFCSIPDFYHNFISLCSLFSSLNVLGHGNLGFTVSSQFSLDFSVSPF